MFLTILLTIFSEKPLLHGTIKMPDFFINFINVWLSVKEINFRGKYHAKYIIGFIS